MLAKFSRGKPTDKWTIRELLVSWGWTTTEYHAAVAITLINKGPPLYKAIALHGMVGPGCDVKLT